MHHTLFKTLKNINHLSARGDQRHLSNLSPIFCKFRVDEHSSDLAGIILIGRVASEHKLTLGRDNWVNTTHNLSQVMGFLSSVLWSMVWTVVLLGVAWPIGLLCRLVHNSIRDSHLGRNGSDCSQCTEIWSEKVPDLSYLGPSDPILKAYVSA